MNILITGCSRGIGYETVFEIAQKGNHKIIGIARSKEPLIRLEKELLKSTFIGIPYNLTDIFNNPDGLIDIIKRSFEHIDVLINNAGTLYRKSFNSFTQDEIESTFLTNLFAPAELIRLLLPIMGKKSPTHIINISSMAGFQGSTKFKGLSCIAQVKQLWLI